MNDNNTLPPEELNPNDAIAFLIESGMLEEAKQLEKRLPEHLRKQGREGFPIVSIATEEWLGKFITQDEDMKTVKKHVRILSLEQDPVLIYGATGTGKELIARALHGSRGGKFISINCAGLPEHLIESELFGHVKGSFTGAATDKQGLFAEAQGGTLFLDEVGELPMTLQAKLLRALQENTIRRVGSNTEEKICTRFVSATHQDLLKARAAKLFRDDLYYRLTTVILELKSLIDRIADIPLIVASINKLQKDTKKHFPEEFDWTNFKNPLEGNVRQLQQIVRRYQLFKELPTLISI